MSGLGGDVRVTGRPKAMSLEELLVGPTAEGRLAQIRNVTPHEYLTRTRVSYVAPAGSIFHKAVDREQWPITRYARELSTRSALEGLFDIVPDATVERDALELRGRETARVYFGPRRLFGFGGPW